MTGWMDDMACRGEGVDPDWWSDTPGLAKHICHKHCDVRAKCDAWAAGQQWMGLVIGGYLRSAGSVRSQVQPIEARDGCQTCKPGSTPPRPLARSFEVERKQCHRCRRNVPLYANGTPMRHKNVITDLWCE